MLLKQKMAFKMLQLCKNTSLEIFMFSLFSHYLCIYLFKLDANLKTPNVMVHFVLCFDIMVLCLVLYFDFRARLCLLSFNAPFTPREDADISLRFVVVALRMSLVSAFLVFAFLIWTLLFVCTLFSCFVLGFYFALCSLFVVYCIWLPFV